MKLLDKILLGDYKTVITVALIFVLPFLWALPLMWLWNWLMPAIFGLVKINLIQSAGIYFLTGLFFRNNGKK